MSRHIFKFEGAKGVQAARQQRRDSKRLLELLQQLTQATLVAALADIPDERVRSACFSMWKEHLTFEPAEDTLAASHELVMARLREAQAQAQGLDEVACASCTAFARAQYAGGAEIRHPQGLCPPGATICEAVAHNPDVPYIVLVPPGYQRINEAPAESGAEVH